MKKILLAAVATLLSVAFCIPVFAEDVVDDVKKEDSKNECCEDDSCNHEFDWIKTEYVPATCTEDSYWITESQCIYCGMTEEEYEGKGIEHKGKEPGQQERLGHLYKVTCNTPATCTENGEYTRACSRCGYTDTVITPATGHQHLTDLLSRTIKEATCTQTGIRRYYKLCTDCGDVAEYNDVTLPKQGHDYNWVYTEITPRTCELDGLTKMTFVCADCGYVAEDATHIRTYAKYNHNRTRVIRKVDATCTKDGYTGDTQCVICNKIIKLGTVVPALGHNYTEVKVEPTCTEDGHITYTCTRCGDTYTTTLPATGHTWGKTVVTRDAEGNYVITRTCVTCGQEETLTQE